MDERQLEYFVGVAEELNFTRAAGRMSVVQSTVSASVRALEKDLATQLLDRTGKQVRLTEAGRAFLPEAKAALVVLDRARAVVRETDTGLRGALRVGTLSGMTALDTPGLARQFSQLHPHVNFYLETSPSGSSGLLDKIRDATLDVGFVSIVRPSDFVGVESRPLRTLPLRVLLSPGHPLSDRASVRLSDIASDPFVEMPRGFGIRTLVDDEFRRLGQVRNIAVQVADLTTIPDFVAAGLGTAIVPDLTRSSHLRLTSVALTGSDLLWTLSAAWRAGTPPSRAAQAVLALAPQFLSEQWVY
ncbi:LysR family transcriptional regulator [Rhodococcus sp. BP-252]|uniref:HTH lysR-type domain-containing protein n=1 Tax=Rhodococcoides kyotonense TaxID=398843 RepID=A0A177YK69_9NOCA|nr:MULTISPECIES: LysR family transcriptional regulator [Rhodococcus]MBY6410663.1 LysR family transcriptional regulator [Rhodococcus sp. BP-320]MBY6415512.1 LysR family transcriptional regulator [Rhodococcus sp. BP-321]MBY6420127.1 LysR family transcriptional regulator [Rhodococcus sp. BP-324]MBY6425219.1 LysR family transcriptional regulator [Rhodococcus sp. BP-323]MBY6430718.1 LysR family transcriptional regulator [Rhodococcus sp. BP-322]